MTKVSTPNPNEESLSLSKTNETVANINEGHKGEPKPDCNHGDKPNKPPPEGRTDFPRVITTINDEEDADTDDDEADDTDDDEDKAATKDKDNDMAKNDDDTEAMAMAKANDMAKKDNEAEAKANNKAEEKTKKRAKEYFNNNIPPSALKLKSNPNPEHTKSDLYVETDNIDEEEQSTVQFESAIQLLHQNESKPKPN